MKNVYDPILLVKVRVRTIIKVTAVAWSTVVFLEAFDKWLWKRFGPGLNQWFEEKKKLAEEARLREAEQAERRAHP